MNKPTDNQAMFEAVGKILAELKAEQGGALVESESRQQALAAQLTARAEQLEGGHKGITSALDHLEASHGQTIDRLAETLAAQAAQADQIKLLELAPQPEPGNDGEHGRDRPLIEPVALKAGREYPKNTLGKHAGGLWIASKHAVGDPLEDPHAWDVVLDGVASIETKHLAGQVFQLTLRQSSGATLEGEFTVPYFEHCGPYTEGDTYHPGQVVTKGYSFWQAVEKTGHAPPGNGWRRILSALKGRKGDDAEIPEALVEEMRRKMAAMDDSIQKMTELAKFFEGVKASILEGGE